MKEKEYDVLVIGGGIAGYYCSKTLAKGGKSVALIEKERLGGTAIRWGALPVKKALDFFKNKGFKLIDTWDEDLQSLEIKMEKDLINKGISIYYGDGEFIDNRTYSIGEEILKGEYIVIATGTRPWSIPKIPIDGNRIITHKEAIDMKNLPNSIIIIGGNVEGVEFATMFGELGIDVTLIEKEKTLLSGNDEDLILPIENHLINREVNIIKGQGAEKAIVEEDRIIVILENGEKIEGDKVLVTFLRRPNFPKGVERLNIQIDENRIYVDENLETGEKNIFAVGDINGIMGMGHVAINQGIQVADYILNGEAINMDYRSLPRAVFTLPEMAGVGRQEWELENIPYKVGYCNLKDTWRGWSKGVHEGYAKIIVDEEGTILGIWLVGENVSEYVALMGLLLDKGITMEDVKSNLIIHPTLMEAVLEAILNVE